MLGLPDDAKKYATMAEGVKDALNKTFLDPATGIYGEKGWKIRKGNSEVPGGLDRLHSPGVSYATFYFDPATGRRFEQGIVTAPSGTWKSPDLPSPQDWALVVDAKPTANR